MKSSKFKTFILNINYFYTYNYNYVRYSYMNIYITLPSMSLLPSEINSISLRLINMTYNLALSGSALYSSNNCNFLGVIWSA